MNENNINNLNVEELERLDKEYVWHPFTQMRDWLKGDPTIIAAGEGSYLIDVKGNRYLDGVSSLWVNVHGHRHPRIDAAVKAQLDRIAHSTLLGLANVPSILLAEKLIRVAPPGLTKVFYSDSGSTAVEVALKIAFQYWKQKDPLNQKRYFIMLDQAYHGDTLGAVSVGGIDLFHGIFRPLLFRTFRMDTPYCYRCKYHKTFPECDYYCLISLENILKRYAPKIAALIIEPLIQGAAGMICQPPGFLKRVEGICRSSNILLICDEVATGFGRTGKMFACEHEDVSPDLMCVAKGISGGYLPLAATLATDEIYNAFLGRDHELKTFFHGHTYTGNPLACAAAIASLELFENEKTLEQLQPKILQLNRLLEEFKELTHVGQVRQKGFMVGIELVRDKQTKEPYPLEEAIGRKVIMEARNQGVILRPLGPVIVLMPPLSISETELDTLLSVTYESIVRVCGR
nr:adenosylmethionine--8-amino-7-oxononanoate transaminase [Desulfobacterales bacterium]